MNFKEPQCSDQLYSSHPKLVEVANAFDTISNTFNIDAVVTRVWDAVCGDSGVHEAHRAVDFRDETRGPNGSEFLYTADEINQIVGHINECYPRDDGKLTCIHHSFQGMPYHFHIQIPLKWTKEEGET